MLEEYGTEFFILALFVVFVWGFNDWMRRLTNELRANDRSATVNTRDVVNELLKLQKVSEDTQKEIMSLSRDVGRLEVRADEKDSELRDQNRHLEDIKHNTYDAAREISNILSHLERNDNG